MPIDATLGVIFLGVAGELRQRYREGHQDQLGALSNGQSGRTLEHDLHGRGTDPARVRGLRGPDQGHRPTVAPRLKHINMLGRYTFTLPDLVTRGELRTLRDPQAVGLDEA